jgi:hypothetical protein
LKFSSPINPEDLLEDRLRAFNWTCLAKARREQIKLIEVPVENIVYVLLVSARNGDSINKGVFSAYARLYAWLSIAGLTGLEPDAGFERIVQEALDWRWLRFEAISDWFSYMGHFNLGVVSLDPTNTSLGLLAISDAGIF